MSAMNGTIYDIKAIIFDMDGVIVDSEPMHLEAYIEMLAAHKVPYSEEQNREFLGIKDIEIAPIMIERWQLPETPQSMVHSKELIFRRIIADKGEPRPGLLNLLEEVNKLEMPAAVASSATLPTIHLVVDTLNIRTYFKSLTSGDEVERGKPAPDVFLLAARRLGVSPADCLVIEDSLNGIKAAKAAGMKCIAIPCDATRHQDHSLADVRMTSLLDVNLHSLTGARA